MHGSDGDLAVGTTFVHRADAEHFVADETLNIGKTIPAASIVMER